MRLVPLFAIPLLALGVPAGAQVAGSAAAPHFTADGFRSHVAFLADDLLEGRKTATRGHEIAARYVAAQFQSYGLTPGGEKGGWYQRVTFQRTERVADQSAITVSGPAGERRWANATDVVVGLNGRELALDVTAPLVFAGYGIENKRFKLDDYRGLDVRGKIVVTLSGYPKGLPSEEGAHLSSIKAEIAESHGAVGMVNIGTLQSMKAFPWKMYLQYAEDPDFDWVEADGRVHQTAPGVRARGSLNTPAAEAVFAGAPRGLAALLREADRAGAAPRGFALETRMRIQSGGKAERVTSPNVIGLLPGSDAKLASEYVVLSAHLDHLGITPAKAGDKPDADRINNGALDNAAGVATMLEVARAAAVVGNRPRRSILFLASTAEEEGLLGADYYANNSTVPIKQIVGNVDLDMPLLLYPFTDVVAFGADHSGFGALVDAAARSMGLALAPDPMPEQGVFTRSDHYRFVRKGVPAIFLATGYANGGAKAWAGFLDGAYHHPNDDLQQPIDWDAGARFAELNYRITRAMADATQAPRWIEGDFFGDTFAPDAPRTPRRVKQALQE